MSMRDLHKRSRELTDDIRAIEQNVAFEKTLKTGEKVLGFRTYDDAITMQRFVVERRAVIDQLRRGVHVVPSLEDMLA